MKSNVQRADFGRLPDGRLVSLFTLTNANRLVVRITDYGTIITELHVRDRQGQLSDIVLGFDNLDQYLSGHPYFGCTVGRVANRIAKGRFTLDGKTYELAVNNGPNHLHGGLKGFDKVLWSATPQPDGSVRFTYSSPDGEEGYPGKLDATVSMTLTDADELRIDYTAVSDRPTPVNLTNHSYFNLAGAGDILSHELMLAADCYTPTDATLIPTGELKSVKATPMDFRTSQPIGSRIGQLEGDEPGYDSNYVINRSGSSLTLAARIRDPKSGRVMEVHTTQPGVQLYTANYLDGSLTGKNGIVYRRHAAFCLETQHFPDSVNQSSFPSVILRPGQTYQHTTLHKFSAQ